ncbi:MAG: porphobilinogen synthase [Chlamydiales bacterium]
MQTQVNSLRLLQRPRRNRKSEAIRMMVQETRLNTSNLVYPQFVMEGRGVREPIQSMPGIYRKSVDLLLKETERALELGISAIALFPVIPRELKDANGTEATNPAGILPRAIHAIKEAFPQICVIADIALDPYTSHGHDGLIDEKGEVLNDQTVERLAEMALVQAYAGVDMVAPSDMMDGRVRFIRQTLDEEGYQQVSIHAYSAKYASCFYGPFREALFSELSGSDKKGYQMNPANRREAILEARLDVNEGADFLMIKPALPYLDVIAKVREATSLPVSAYQVSGEYAMIMAADQKGWLDGQKAFWESVLSIKRAGADVIFTYAAPLIAKMITSGAHG